MFVCLFVCLSVCLSVCLFGLVWFGLVWFGLVVWCGVVWCGVVWCGVVWCGVVWCGVVWCGVVLIVWQDEQHPPLALHFTAACGVGPGYVAAGLSRCVSFCNRRSSASCRMCSGLPLYGVVACLDRFFGP